MTEAAQGDPSLTVAAVGAGGLNEFRLPSWAQYAIALVLVVIATFIAYVASPVVPSPGLTLIFVLPVVIAGLAYGLGQSIVATVASVFAFDFFFTQPYFSVRMTDPSDIWAAGLLLLTAEIVSTVAWQSRQYALAAMRSAAQTEELRRLAHALVAGVPQQDFLQAAANTIGRLFEGPALVLSRGGGALRVAAATPGAELSEAEFAAARSISADLDRIRAQTYPHEASRFDMWSVTTRSGVQYVLCANLGPERPANADQLIEIVAGYLVVNAARS